MGSDYSCCTDKHLSVDSLSLANTGKGRRTDSRKFFSALIFRSILWKPLIPAPCFTCCALARSLPESSILSRISWLRSLEYPPSLSDFISRTSINTLHHADECRRDPGFMGGARLSFGKVSSTLRSELVVRNKQQQLSSWNGQRYEQPKSFCLSRNW